MTEKCLTIAEEGIKKIVQDELRPLQKEFKQVKTWMFALMSFLVVSMFGMGVWVGSINARVDANTIQHRGLEDRVDTRLERVDAKLERIEDLLLQLTKDISNK